jgi:hypothetical protein
MNTGPGGHPMPPGLWFSAGSTTNGPATPKNQTTATATRVRPARGKQVANPKTKTHPGLLAVLASGDNVTASDNEGRTWSGTIDLVAPALGIMWVHTDEGEIRRP